MVWKSRKSRRTKAVIRSYYAGLKKGRAMARRKSRFKKRWY